MLKQLPATIKIESGKDNITEYPGVLALLGELRRHGLIEFFDEALPPRISNRSYKPSEHACTYLFSRYAGGYCLDDTLRISTDETLKGLIGVEEMPKPNTLGQ